MSQQDLQALVSRHLNRLRDRRAFLSMGARGVSVALAGQALSACSGGGSGSVSSPSPTPAPAPTPTPTPTSTSTEPGAYWFYRPHVENYVVEAANAGNPYNHDATIAKFRGHYMVAWNTGASTEGDRQYNVVKWATSPANFASTPFRAEWFEAASSDNPVYTEDSIVSWQPAAIEIPEAGKLFALWCTTPISHTPPPFRGFSPAGPYAGQSVVRMFGCYLSSRSDYPAGRWRNQRFHFGADNSVTLSDAVGVPATGTEALVKLNRAGSTEYYAPFPVCDVYRDQAGRYIFPVILCRVNPADAANGWFGGYFLDLRQKFLAAALYSSDGVNWRLSGTHSNRPFYIQDYVWENAYAQRSNGTYRMFVRYPFIYGDPQHMRGSSLMMNDFNDLPAKTMLTPSGYETTITRIAIKKTSANRHIMVTNDYPPAEGGFALSDRQVLSAFFARDGLDFVPGVPIAPTVSDRAYYPALCIDGNDLLCVYTFGVPQGRIGLAILRNGIPADDRLYILPRSNATRFVMRNGLPSSAETAGTDLVLRGWGSAGVETETGNWRINLDWNLASALTDGEEAVLFTIGDFFAFTEVVVALRSGQPTMILRESYTNADTSYSTIPPTVTQTTIATLTGSLTAKNALSLSYIGGKLSVNSVTAGRAVRNRAFLGKGVFGNITYAGQVAPAITLTISRPRFEKIA